MSIIRLSALSLALISSGLYAAKMAPKGQKKQPLMRDGCVSNVQQEKLNNKNNILLS